MARKLFPVGIAVIILLGVAIIMAAQNRPPTEAPGISGTWVHLNDNVAIALKPCPDPKKGGDPYAKIRGDLCGSLMVRVAPDSGWHRVLLDSPPAAMGRFYPVEKLPELSESGGHWPASSWFPSQEQQSR